MNAVFPDRSHLFEDLPVAPYVPDAPRVAVLDGPIDLNRVLADFDRAMAAPDTGVTRQQVADTERQRTAAQQAGLQEVRTVADVLMTPQWWETITEAEMLFLGVERAPRPSMVYAAMRTWWPKGQRTRPQDKLVEVYRLRASRADAKLSDEDKARLFRENYVRSTTPPEHLPEALARLDQPEPQHNLDAREARIRAAVETGRKIEVPLRYLNDRSELAKQVRMSIAAENREVRDRRAALRVEEKKATEVVARALKEMGQIASTLRPDSPLGVDLARDQLSLRGQQRRRASIADRVFDDLKTIMGLGRYPPTASRHPCGDKLQPLRQFHRVTIKPWRVD